MKKTNDVMEKEILRTKITTKTQTKSTGHAQTSKGAKGKKLHTQREREREREEKD